MTKALLKNPRTTSDHGDAPHTARPHTITNEPKKNNSSDPNHSTNTNPTPTGGPMLASTIQFQFSNHHPTRTPTPHQQAPGNRPGGHTGNHTPHQGPVAAREPNSTHHTTQSNTTLPRQQARAATTNHRTRQTPATKPCKTMHAHILRRKEVIQPHLPVRLPCYDLVPITSLTLRRLPHKGRATGFGCYPLS